MSAHTAMCAISSASTKIYYSCHACQETFHDMCNQINHLQTHMKKEPYVCVQCEMTFSENDSLQEHLKIHANGNFNADCALACTFCQEFFPCSVDLNKHLITCNAEKHVACDFCNLQFEQQTKLDIHMQTCQSKYCYQDPSTFLSTVEPIEVLSDEECIIVKEINLSCATNTPKERCFICEKPFSNLTKYSKHLKKHYTDCKKSKKNCNSKELIKSDTKSPIVKYNKVFVSDQKVTTSKKFSLLYSSVKKYGCNKCGKTFFNIEQQINHLRLHSEQKPYVCFYCKMTFDCDTILNEHLKIHAKENFVEKFGICSLCLKTFTCERDLGKHSILTGEKLYLCDCCKMKFLSRSNLVEHIKSHIPNDLEIFVKDSHKNEFVLNDRLIENYSSVIQDDVCEDCKECFSSARYLSRPLKLPSENDSSIINNMSFNGDISNANSNMKRKAKRICL